MKNAALLILILLLSGCSVLPKGGTSYFGEERIFSKLFTQIPLQYRQAQGCEPGWELGIAFVSHKAGRITALHIKNPTIGVVPITIWDANTRQIVFQQQVNLDGSNAYQKIYLPKPVMIEANKKYCITINVAKYFYQNLVFETMPVNLQDITLLGSVYEETYYPRYPQFEINNVLHGLIDIDIQWKI